MADCRAAIVRRVREHGPITFARFMDIALYDEECGYYARASRRSGRSGDFFTSVDVGPIFGELLAAQFVEMWEVLAPSAERRTPRAEFDLVEAGAGSGRFARQVLDAATRVPAFYDALRLHLVERSRTARAAQPIALGPHAGRLHASSADLPASIDGVLFANELLDALPTHLVVMRADGLREVYVDAEDEALVEREGPPSTPRIAGYFDRLGIALAPGWRAEVNLEAVDWVRQAGRSIVRGFLLLIDYGHPARALYSAARAAGTLTTFRQHVAETGPPPGGRPPAWLTEPGGCDITAHVDLTSIQHTAEAEGLDTLCIVDQSYFLLALAGAARIAGPHDDLKRRLALKTLLLPGGIGTTHKVMVFAKNVGRPALRGCAPGGRLT